MRDVYCTATLCECVLVISREADFAELQPLMYSLVVVTLPCLHHFALRACYNSSSSLPLTGHRHFSNFCCDGLVRPAPLWFSEMILSQGGAWISSRSPLLRSAEFRQVRFTTRRGRRLSSVTVLGVPEQSAGLLFKGGASGDVGSFSAPVGTSVARTSHGSIRRSTNMSKSDVVIAVLPVRRR